MQALAASSRENVVVEGHPVKMQRVDPADQQPLRVKKLRPDAILPKRGSVGAAGYDLARCGAGWGGVTSAQS